MAQRITDDEGNKDELAKNVLVEANAELQDDLHPSKSLLEDLAADNILTQAEYEEIDPESQKPCFDKNNKLLDAMRRKSAEQIGRFCQFLIDHGQLHIGEILKSSMSPN